ncbi:MAG TPA: MEDS domain-containing protein [Bryobacteraceae bacterium]|nr:MEDS domain-containing protein [Bryobacteraceae bacterium]
MAPLLDVLEAPPPCSHYLQLYDQDRLPLAQNVAAYISEGLKRQEGALLIATPEHQEMFRDELTRREIDSCRPLAESGILFLDAHETLSRFLVDGEPDEAKFREVVAAAICQVKAARPTGLRAYGEMVAVLWAAGRRASALRLDKFWETLLHDREFSLFSAYPIDIFSPDFQIPRVDAILCDHTHLIPTGEQDKLAGAVNFAIDTVLGPEAQSLKQLIKANYRPAWAVLPEAEGIILWLRNNLPRQADEILNLARRHYNSHAQLGERAASAGQDAAGSVK